MRPRKPNEPRRDRPVGSPISMVCLPFNCSMKNSNTDKLATSGADNISTKCWSKKPWMSVDGVCLRTQNPSFFSVSPEWGQFT